VVVAGDSLWKLAKTNYGDGMMWTTIAKANPELSPDVLAIGATIQIPPAN
jgi:5'-nucleotidase